MKTLLLGAAALFMLGVSAPAYAHCGMCEEKDKHGEEAVDPAHAAEAHGEEAMEDAAEAVEGAEDAVEDAAEEAEEAADEIHEDMEDHGHDH